MTSSGLPENFDSVAIRDAIRDGSLSASEAVSDVLARIDAANPTISALTQVFHDEARASAAAIDKKLVSGESPGPLAGVPFTVKANICSREGVSDASSKIIPDYRAPYEATVVERLKNAGAILVGKTNLDEFGMGSSTENSVHGPTRNPWDTDCVPGGSSGGAAAAAATFGAFHLGSDTGGSIRQPSSYCGVTGFKPTYGRVSRYGLLAFASSLDQIGPLARTARECAMALETIAGTDPMDSTSADLEVPDCLGALDRGVEGMKIGIPKEYFNAGIDDVVRERVERAIETFRGLGVATEEISLPHTEYANPTYVIISGAEASSNLGRYDGVHYGHRTADPSDLIDMYSRSRGEGFGPEVKRRVMVGTFVLSSGYYDAFYLKAMKVRRLIRNDYEEAFKRVDAVICPTSPVVAFPLGSRLDDPLKLYAVDILTVSANLAAIPGVSFPCGFTDEGLPVGAQIFGRHFEDDRVLALAHAFQIATDFHTRMPPVLNPGGPAS
jgi:aspartyl-tRNA(Asn)/glutamyl-tRNA(Gln) amidotransferase subunit A